MTIVVRRRTGGFAVVRRLRVRLDGRTVARVWRGRAVEFVGSGQPQQLSVSIDWASSGQVTVIDPGPASMLELEVTDRGMVDSALRSWLAPKSTLVLVPVGHPVPPTPPMGLGWRRVIRIWAGIAVAALLWAAFMALTTDASFDAAAVASVVIGASLGFALISGLLALIVRRR